MKKRIEEEMAIPDGVSCSFAGNVLTVSKSGVSLTRVLDLPSIKIDIKGNKITFLAEKGNRNELKYIKSSIAHINNLFSGLTKKYTYKLEACNVHFPMTLKSEPGFLVITNFLGEKVPRKAKILPGVELEVKGVKITVSSNNKEAAGLTATNIEKATKIRNRDRRVFQDGIFLVEKPIGVAK